MVLLVNICGWRQILSLHYFSLHKYCNVYYQYLVSVSFWLPLLTDINECSINTDGCAHSCSNTIGSYTCSCRTGYRLASNGRSCEGILGVASIIIMMLQQFCGHLYGLVAGVSGFHSMTDNNRGEKDVKWNKIPWVTHGKDLHHQIYEWLMGLIYVIYPMSHSWEGFTSFLSNVNSPRVAYKCNIHGNDLHTFH